MPAEATAEAICPKLGATDRSDAWWAGPLVTGLGLGGIVLYSTFRAVYNRDAMFWAWTSLFVVGFADFYIWMAVAGQIPVLRIF